MKYNLEKGDRVIAKRNCSVGDFIKGDTLEIVEEGVAFDFRAKNITRPHLNKNDVGVVLVNERDIKPIYKRKAKCKGNRTKIYLLGIPLITIRKVDE